MKKKEDDKFLDENELIELWKDDNLPLPETNNLQLK